MCVKCNQADGTCDEMAAEIKFKDRVAPEDAAKYKYVLDGEFDSKVN